jgi:membrane-associated phospholipid phosphatase
MSGERLSLRLRVLGGVVLSAMLIALAFGLDDAADAWVKAHSNPMLRQVASKLSFYGDWPFWMLGAGVALGVVWRLGRRELMRRVVVMMVVSSLAGAVVNVSKATTGRTRPNAKAQQGWYGLRREGRWLVGVHAFNSFPSGHTASAIGFAVPLLLWAPEVGVPVLLVAVCVGGSRIYLRAHHLSDVTTAAVVAWWMGWWAVRWWSRREGEVAKVDAMLREQDGSML